MASSMLPRRSMIKTSRGEYCGVGLEKLMANLLISRRDGHLFRSVFFSGSYIYLKPDSNYLGDDDKAVFGLFCVAEHSKDGGLRQEDWYQYTSVASGGDQEFEKE